MRLHCRSLGSLRGKSASLILRYSQRAVTWGAALCDQPSLSFAVLRFLFSLECLPIMLTGSGTVCPNCPAFALTSRPWDCSVLRTVTLSPLIRCAMSPTVLRVVTGFRLVFAALVVSMIVIQATTLCSICTPVLTVSTPCSCIMEAQVVNARIGSQPVYNVNGTERSQSIVRAVRDRSQPIG
jgi:hypothetical protein